MASEEKTNDSPAVKVVAVIDIGSNAIRMSIAEVFDDGRVEVLERLQRAVRLGQDSFRRGRLGGQSMRAAVSILRDYKQMIKLYRVERVRAVATSAVREASNSDTFLDRIFMATGFQVEVIGTSEESRLTVSAVRNVVGDSPGINKRETLIADVGGGNTLLTIMHKGEIVNSLSLRLGSIRLQEMLSTTEELPKRSSVLLRQYISKELSTIKGSLPLHYIHSFVAVGGDARFAARELGQTTKTEDLVTVTTTAFNKLVKKCERYTTEELAKRFGLPFAEAETLNPALFVYQLLLQATKANKMVVSHASMRDGLLLELAREVTGQEDEAISQGVIHSAVSLGEKYRIDPNHAADVADLSIKLFDELQTDHGLTPRYRLLLRVAALLHEIGAFVSDRAHHKHSYYVISHSELFGLNRSEIAIVAHVARYHRRSVPKPSHLEYSSLPRETRVVINKLSAILRMADALVRGIIENVQDLRFERNGDELIIHVANAANLLLEERAIANKGGLFEDIYGLKVRLEAG